MAEYKVFVSKFDPIRTRMPERSVVLTPRNPGWNDFGYQVAATITIKGVGDKFLSLDAFVVVLSDSPDVALRSSFAGWVDELLALTNERLVPVEFDELKFLTLLDDDKSYRDLAGWCDSLEERFSILLAIGDICLARVQGSIVEETLEQVIADDVFALGVLRTGSGYRAFEKGPRYVARAVIPWSDDARANIAIDVLLNGFQAPHATTLTFDGAQSLVSDRVQVLIGKNGTGKSQLLRHVIGSLALRADTSGQTIFPDVPNDDFSATAAQWNALPNAVLVFSTDHEDLLPRTVRLDAPLDYWYFSFASQAEHVPSAVPAAMPLGRAVVYLMRDDSLLNGVPRFQIFENIVDPILPLSLIHLPLKRLPKKVSGAIKDIDGLLWFPLSDVPVGEQALLYLASAVDLDRDLALIDSERRPFPPSSGQRVYLRFAALSLCAISQASLIVLDEPETHLHPNFVSEFMNLLHDLLTATSSIALIATHSPYVVREVPTSCVHVVSKDSNTPSIGSVHLKTLGASVSSISDAVFGDAAATKFHRKVAIALSRQGKKAAADEAGRVSWLLENFGEELNSEMLSTIRFLMSSTPQKDSAEEHDA
ncbi:AAA family ATPase [Roseateles sp.]|uniref:AAA family ATPase n=1 Tax=Roseateles sp. TaxID=1971397 RepID=UPI0035A14555